MYFPLNLFSGVSAVADFTSVTTSGPSQNNLHVYVFIASYLVTGNETTADNNEELGLTRFIRTSTDTGMTGWTISSESLSSTLPDNVKRMMYKVPSATTGSVGVFKWTYGVNSVITIRVRPTGKCLK